MTKSVAFLEVEVLLIRRDLVIERFGRCSSFDAKVFAVLGIMACSSIDAKVFSLALVLPNGVPILFLEGPPKILTTLRLR